MVNYPEIYELLRREKYSEKLQFLEKNFLTEVISYLIDKQTLLEREREERPGIFNETIEKTKKQLDNARSMIRELFMLRERKVVELALLASKTGVSKNDLVNMLNNEKELFNSILSKLEENQRSLSLALDNIKAQLKDDNLLVRFNEPIPKFVDLNGNELGPFNEKDVANLPKKIAETLLKGKKVELVKI